MNIHNPNVLTKSPESKRALKYMLSPLSLASRNKRELSVINEIYDEVIVLDKAEQDVINLHKEYTQISRKFNYSSNWFLKRLQLILCFLVIEPRYIKKFNADIISCHDLSALAIGWLSTLSMKKNRRPKLVYDAHEFELGRNVGKKRNKLKLIFIFIVEQFLIKKCNFSIMVSESIADEIQKIYRLREKPIVVRNIPPNWSLDESIINAKKDFFYQQLNLSKDNGLLLMYHGFITSGRGIETLIDLMSNTKSMGLVILGFGESKYIKKLNELAIHIGVSDKILFLDAVPLENLWQYVGAADVGMVTIPDDNKNEYFMLPNKLFENIQSKTPLIVSDFPEIKKIIEHYDIGICVNPKNLEEILNALNKMMLDKIAYARYKSNLERAKSELCWENERVILINAYSKSLG